jgi:hypothetical protein
MQLARRKELGSWTEQWPKIVRKWNSTKNSVTQLMPLEAHKDENALETRLGITIHAKFDRKYPELNIGDEVRIRKKKESWKKKPHHIGLMRSTRLEIYFTAHNMNQLIVRCRQRQNRTFLWVSVDSSF